MYRRFARFKICVLGPLLLVLFLAAPVAAPAQEGPAPEEATSDRPLVRVPWSPYAGIYEMQPDGTLTGYFAELARLVAGEAGFDVEFVGYESTPDVIAAQMVGDTDMLAGGSGEQALRRTNILSSPVLKSSVYLIARSDAPADWSPDTLEGARIGVIRNTTGSEPGALAERNTILPYGGVEDALGALLLGQIDAVISVRKVIFDTLRQWRLDHRVRTVGPPLMEPEHYVLLHQSRAELMPRINAALARLQDSGALTELGERWGLGLAAPVPDVLTVGVSHFPPYQVVTEDGTLTGFGVESLRDLAERAGVQLQFKEISTEDWAAGPSPDRYDILPPISVNADRQRRMDFTTPIQQSPYSIFVRAGSGEGIADLDDLVGLRVGVGEQNVARARAEAHGGLDLEVYDNAAGLLDGLLAGEVDAILYPTMTVRRLAATGGFDSRIEEVRPPFEVTERAIALRPGLATVRERLNGVIPGYLSSEQYIALREDWLGTPEFWTPERLRMAQIGVVLISLLVVAAFLVQNVLARRNAERLAAETRRVSNRLTAILDAAQSGVIGLTAGGQIAAVNPSGRLMLGELDRPIPFPWPETLAFVDPEKMVPLGAHTPVARAMDGEVLRGETALLRRANSDEPRYVRVSTAPVKARDAGDVATVVILDDITEQERNRQQMERSGRLDALGQLTGGVAHDFNNILATIEYAVQLVKSEASPRMMPFLDTAHASVRRGAELTKRLLAFAKRQPGMESSVKTSRVLADFRDLAAPTIEKSIDLVINDEDEDLRVFCDVGQLENALLNLVLNSRDAIIAAGMGDRISVSVRSLSEVDSRSSLYRSGGGEDDGQNLRYVEFSVTDNGPGMTEEVRRRAIDPFFTTKGQNSGTGLGLSMVYGFVEQSNGELRIYSEEGLGTTVSLVLPRGTEDNRREAPHKRAKAPKGQGQRILVVEDEESLLSIVTEVVRSLNYEVLPASSGREALDLVEAGEPFDLLLTDVVMPGGIGGFKLAAEVRKRLPDMPVVYMTGYSGLLEAEMGAVVAPTLQKPCPPVDLAKTLKQELEG
ncbi:transporter substrate-binding domain-containing protein [Ferrimonas balearica]|nr:transporter substrate-binding domain-containing protein [Ferrimonas balearica]